MTRSFYLLNLVQFLVAINENIFKTVVAYFIISLSGPSEATWAMVITSTLFICPFLLFSYAGGILADKFSKQKIILITRLFDLAILGFSLIAFITHSLFGCYIALFCLSTSSAIFGPSKYGIVPEIIEENKIYKANSLIASFTYLAIIFGTSVASLFTQYLSFSFAIFPTLAFALIALISTFFIQQTKAINPDRSWNLLGVAELIDTYHDLIKSKKLLLALFCFSYPFFFGAFTQLNIIPYAIDSLNLKSIDGGYLLAIAGLGIVLGALLSRKDLPSFYLPYSLFGLSILFICLGILPSSLLLTILLLGALGLLGGVFIVLAQTLLMTESSEKSRGRNFGSGNFFSFTFALLAAGSLYLLGSIFDYSAKERFIWVGCLNLLVGLFVLNLTFQSKTN